MISKLTLDEESHVTWNSSIDFSRRDCKIQNEIFAKQDNDEFEKIIPSKDVGNL
jgi:hypothetical protein